MLASGGKFKNIGHKSWIEVIDSFTNLGKFRSSRPQVFYKKGVLKNLAKFTGKHLCQSLFLI